MSPPDGAKINGALSNGGLPQAYRSTATHFTPIVLTADDEKASTKLKSFPKSAEEREKHTAQKIRELKKMVMRNSIPKSLAQDLESEVGEDHDCHDHHSSLVANISSKSTVPSKQIASTADQIASFGHQGHYSQGHVSDPYQGKIVHTEGKGPFQGRDDLSQGHTVIMPPGGPYRAPGLQPYQSIPNSQNQAQFLPALIDPNLGQVQGQFSMQAFAQGQGQVPLQPIDQFQRQIPIQEPGTLAQPTVQGTAPVFQIQLLQDPRTGLFQIVPVPVPQAQPQPNVGTTSVFHGSHTSLDTFSPVSSTHSQHDGHNVSLSSHGSQSPGNKPRSLSLGQDRNLPVEKVHYVKHANRDNYHAESKALKYRARSNSNDNKQSRHLSVADDESEVKDILTSTVTKQRSQILGSSEMERDIAQFVGQAKEVESAICADLPRLTRATSDDLWEKIENVGTSTKPVTGDPETVKVKDPRMRLKRANSGSSIDYHRKNITSDIRAYDIYDDTGPVPHKHSTKNRNPPATTYPNLGHVLVDDSARSGQMAAARVCRKSDVIDIVPSPPPSPSLSKDSGLGSWNFKRTGDVALMEKLLSSEAIKNQEKLSRVIKLVRDEFAFDGYMENGIEDLTMGR